MSLTPLAPSSVLEYLRERRVSVWSVAIRMNVDPTHLRRVLTGRRRGSQALLEAVMEKAQYMDGRPPRGYEDTARLIAAATHVFFLARADFDSAIFATADEDWLYGPGVRKCNRERLARRLEKKGFQCPD
jgi:hypothetical protein